MTCYCGSCPSCDEAQGIRSYRAGDRAESECIGCGELIPARYALCDACSLAAESGVAVEEIEIEEIIE